MLEVENVGVSVFAANAWRHKRNGSLKLNYLMLFSAKSKVDQAKVKTFEISIFQDDEGLLTKFSHIIFRR